MTLPARRPATYADVLALPAHQVGQVLAGELHVQPRPGPLHALAAAGLGEELGPPFKRGRGGPGGWVILGEPELHLADDVVVPDLAGWRRERMPEVPIDEAFFRLAPDWACEIESPSTRRVDRGVKREIYRRERVRWVWAIDPEAQLLEVFVLESARYAPALTASGTARVRAVPFDAIELDLSILWQR